MSTSANDPAGEAVAAEVDAVVAAAFMNITAKNQHAPTGLSLSGVGGCTRKAAYAIAATPPSDVHPPAEKRAANLGQFIHDGLLPDMAEEAGGHHEVPVKLSAAGIVIDGTLDLRWPTVMIDLKTVKQYKLAYVRRTGQPYPEHLIQVGGYALAAIQSGYPISWLVFVYIDRSDGDRHTLAVKFTNALMMRVVDRVGELVRYSKDPDNAPRELHGPGVSLPCDECSWLKRCWGPDAEPGVWGPQSRLRDVPEELAAALEAHTRASALESEAAKIKKWTGPILEDLDPDVYGNYEVRRDRDYQTPDRTAAITKLQELGAHVPMMTRRGNLHVRAVETPPQASAEGK